MTTFYFFVLLFIEFSKVADKLVVFFISASFLFGVITVLFSQLRGRV